MLTVCGVAVAGRCRDERRWYDHWFVRVITYALCSVLDEACCGWDYGNFPQSVEQRCREVEAAYAASVTRLVRGVYSCHDALNAPLLLFPELVYVALVMVWSGEFRSWQAANSRGTHIIVAALPALLWWCILWNVVLLWKRNRIGSFKRCM